MKKPLILPLSALALITLAACRPAAPTRTLDPEMPGWGEIIQATRSQLMTIDP